MSITAREDISISKEDFQESKDLGFGSSMIQFAHKFTGGELSVNLLSLTSPIELTSNGFIQATASEIASASLSVFGKRLRLSLSRGIELKQWVHYITSGNMIIFLGALKDSGGALPGEILFGEIETAAKNSVIVGDTKWVTGTKEVAVGQTVVNIGVPFLVNANPSDQIGDIKITRNGQRIYRNVGNAAAGLTADGNFQELDNGTGMGTMIQLNNAPVGQSDIIEYEVGLKVASADSMMLATLDRLENAIIRLAGDSAAGFYGDADITRYLAAAPSALERKQLGDLYTLLNTNFSNFKTGINTTGNKEFRISVPNGRGSVNTAIRRFSNVDQPAPFVAYTDSVTLGSEFKILQAGLYFTRYADRRGDATTCIYGVSRNSTQLSTDIAAISNLDRVSHTQIAQTDAIIGAQGMAWCNVGDILRGHTNPAAAPTSTETFSMLHIVQVIGV